MARYTYACLSPEQREGKAISTTVLVKRFEAVARKLLAAKQDPYSDDDVEVDQERCHDSGDYDVEPKFTMPQSREPVTLQCSRYSRFDSLSDVYYRGSIISGDPLSDDATYYNFGRYVGSIIQLNTPIIQIEDLKEGTTRWLGDQDGTGNPEEMRTIAGYLTTVEEGVCKIIQMNQINTMRESAD
jgi:hypothetical protein